MLACYDLSINPPTYDVCTFLAHAELERIKRNEDHLDIRITPGPKQGFRRDNLWPSTIEGRKALLQNVVIPMCWLLPSVKNVTVESKTAGFKGAFGFERRLISLPNFLTVMKADMRPLRSRPFTRTNERKEHLVTITLRECEHHPKRNSNFQEWVKAAHIMKEKGYDVVFVRDTLNALQKVEGFKTDSASSLHLWARSCLYDSARINFGVNNGPMWMAVLMNAPLIMMKPTTNMAGCYDDQYYMRNGLPPGSQLPTSPSHQKIIWKDDRCEDIIQAFDEEIAK